MYTVDKHNFKRYLRDFPKQILDTSDIMASGKLTIDYKSIGNVIIFGMGGSAISGDVYKNIFSRRLTRPVEVVRNYTAPAYCGKNTLVIACSYSGNTEETLAALEDIRSSGCQIVCITSGGKLKKMAAKHKWQIVEIPGGYPPRQAFGYIFTPLIYLLNPLLDEEIGQDEIDRVANMMNLIINRNDDMVGEGKLLAKDLAFELHHKIPIVYAATPFLEAVARRWKNQFQENAKSMAFANVIPEMNHNEIVGWEMDHKLIGELVVIFLENEDLHPRISARLDLTKNIIRDRGIEVVEIYSEGTTPLEQALSLICTSDWVSYYLALLYERDPEAIVNIDFLKSALEKQST
jgi:glucose/mannose-6-phosphate isomerase